MAQYNIDFTRGFNLTEKFQDLDENHKQIVRNKLKDCVNRFNFKFIYDVKEIRAAFSENYSMNKINYTVRGYCE